MKEENKKENKQDKLAFKYQLPIYIIVSLITLIVLGAFSTANSCGTGFFAFGIVYMLIINLIVKGLTTVMLKVQNKVKAKGVENEQPKENDKEDK